LIHLFLVRFNCNQFVTKFKYTFIGKDAIVKSFGLKTMALYASIIAAVSGLVQPTYFDEIYAIEKPSDSIPFCDDESLPIHTFCLNMDGQAGPRLDGLTQWGTEVAKGILERIDR
jgi:hypothetical protein